MARDVLRVALAEDSVLLRAGLVRLLDDAGVHMVGAYDNAATLLSRPDEIAPDVVVVDVRLPPTFADEGLRAAREIRRRWPLMGVLVLSQYVEVGLATQLLSQGVDGVGYLLKDRIANVAEFAAAVRRVGDRGSALDPTVAHPPDTARERGARPDGARTLKPCDRGGHGRQRARRREVRDRHLRQARARRHAGGAPAGARRPEIPGRT